MIRILIVEDDENISKMLAATLSIGDYEYDRCADGEEAVQTILNGTYDLILLDVTTKGKVSAKEILKQPLHQPLLIGSLLGIAVSAISAKVGFFVIPSCIYDPINMIGNSAVPMILMAFGMSLHGTKPLQDKSNIPAVFTVAVLKNIVMPIIAFLLSYFVMGFRGATLYACVVLAALPTGQNVYNYAARYNVGLSFARDGILFSTLSSPIFIAIIAVLLG